MKKKLLNSVRMLLVAAGLLVGGNAWATVVTYDLTGKFKTGTSTACTLTDGKITAPEAIAAELNKNTTYSFTWSGSPRAKGDGSGVDVSTAANGTFTINGLSGGEMIIVKLHTQNTSSGTFTVAKGQKCTVDGVDVESTSAKAISLANGTYTPIYMKSGATSLTITSATAYTILESVTISTANTLYERNTTYGDANIWTSSDLTAWSAGNGFSVDVPASAEDATDHYGLGINPNSQNGNRTATKSFSITSDGSKIKYDITWYIGGAPGSTNSGSYNSLYLKIGNNICLSWNQTHGDDSNGNYYAVHLTKNGTCSTSSSDVLVNLAKNSYHTKDIVVIFNRVTKQIERFTFGGTDYTSKVTGTFDEDFNNITAGFERKTTGTSSKNFITSMSVTEYSQHQPYTINYTYEGSTVKSEEGTAVLGSTVNASYTSFWNDGSTQKYYVADDATTSMVIAENGNTLNVALRQAAADAVASVNAVDSEGTVLATFTGGTGIEGEAYDGYVYYTRAVLHNGQYYTVPAANGNTYNYGKNGLVYGTPGTVTYTLDESVAYYTEVENNLVKSRSEALTNRTDAKNHVPYRASGGAWYTLYGTSSGGAYVYTPSNALSAGVYQLEVSARNFGSNAGSVAIKVRTSAGVMGDAVATLSWNSAENAVKTVSYILVPEGGSVALCNPNNSNSNVCLDYIILHKLYDVTDASKVVGAVDYSTTDRGATHDLATLSDGEVYKVTFKNHGSTGALANNFLAYIKNSSSTIVATMYADWYDHLNNNSSSFVSTYTTSLDGGLTLAGNCWENYDTDMADSEVELTFSYSGGTLYIAGTATKGTDIYYYNYNYGGLEGNVTVGLSVCAAWIEITSTATSADITGTIASSGYSSIAVPYALELSSATGISAAYVVSATTNDVITLSSIETAVPAGTPLILKGEANSAYNIPVAASGTVPTTNLLSASIVPTGIEANAAYILQGGKFHLVTAASTVPAGKAYLPATAVSSDAHALSFVFSDDETTGINNVNVNVNHNDNWYDLQGRRVAAPQKGLYIMNGKKVIIK